MRGLSHRIVLAVAGLVLAVPLAGCSQAEEAARGAAESAATQAASAAGEAAKDTIRQQICRIAQDGISPEEATAIREAADAAERAGVPQEIVDAARAVAEAGVNAPREAVERLQQECREATP
jgi:hypothetical protein